VVQVRLKGHPPHSRTFERKTDATRWAQETEAGIRSGRLRSVAVRQRHTLAELIDRYVSNELPGKPAVAVLYGRHLAWWREELGAYYLDDLTSDQVEESYCKLLREPGDTGRKRTSATANRYLISLSACFSYGRSASSGPTAIPSLTWRRRESLKVGSASCRAPWMVRAPNWIGCSGPARRAATGISTIW
jgi:hypothetical protein